MELQKYFKHCQYKTFITSNFENKMVDVEGEKGDVVILFAKDIFLFSEFDSE